MGSTLYRMICIPSAATGISEALKKRELAVVGWRMHVHKRGCLSKTEQ